MGCVTRNNGVQETYVDFRDNVAYWYFNFNFDSMVTPRSLKVMPHYASLRQDSLRQDSLRQDSLKQRVAYRAPGFERSCAQNGRKTH